MRAMELFASAMRLNPHSAENLNLRRTEFDSLWPKKKQDYGMSSVLRRCGLL